MGVQLSKKLIQSSPENSERGLVLMHWCPGCKTVHAFHITKPNHCNAKWSWDGNVENPTFNPSMLMGGHCHYFLHNGKIQYLDDCAHEFAGKVVDLPELPAYLLEDNRDEDYLYP